MAHEAGVDRATVFVAGQNLFHSAQGPLVAPWPAMDALKLARYVRDRHSWERSPRPSALANSS